MIDFEGFGITKQLKGYGQKALFKIQISGWAFKLNRAQL